jgi:tetratricopeptide (TPR) repeat protein
LLLESAARVLAAREKTIRNFVRQHVVQNRNGAISIGRIRANLARAYAASGKRSEAVKLLSELKKHSIPSYSHASEIAVIYASLGDADQAMNWLEKAYEERFNPSVLLRPGFDPLRSDQRFEDLVRRIGLPPWTRESDDMGKKE